MSSRSPHASLGRGGFGDDMAMATICLNSSKTRITLFSRPTTRSSTLSTFCEAEFTDVRRTAELASRVFRRKDVSICVELDGTGGGRCEASAFAGACASESLVSGGGVIFSCDSPRNLDRWCTGDGLGGRPSAMRWSRSSWRSLPTTSTKWSLMSPSIRAMRSSKRLNADVMKRFSASCERNRLRYRSRANVSESSATCRSKLSFSTCTLETARVVASWRRVFWRSNTRLC
mmetsp:Transcript_6151/g.18872  ORF Transcript_6151/g.18872 Transcript_6151/m.18872 type:complete len:231 (+) Transcript_6151:575-1267(+)|eukprot:scaffold319532_cov28-Tisochrysis_lutea.AAC.5